MIPHHQINTQRTRKIFTMDKIISLKDYLELAEIDKLYWLQLHDLSIDFKKEINHLKLIELMDDKCYFWTVKRMQQKKIHHFLEWLLYCVEWHNVPCGTFTWKIEKLFSEMDILQAFQQCHWMQAQIEMVNEIEDNQLSYSSKDSVLLHSAGIEEHNKFPPVMLQLKDLSNDVPIHFERCKKIPYPTALFILADRVIDRKVNDRISELIKTAQ